MNVRLFTEASAHVATLDLDANKKRELLIFRSRYFIRRSDGCYYETYPLAVAETIAETRQHTHFHPEEARKSTRLTHHA